MRWYRRSTLLGALVLVILMGATVQEGSTGNTELTRESLRGLSGVYVLVERLADDAKQTGLTEELLRTETELRLRKAGIRILTRAEALEAQEVPYVSVEVVAGAQRDGLYAYGVRVGLSQYMYLERTHRSHFGMTWLVNATGTVGANNIRQGVKEVVGELVDKFLNAYLSVNPHTVSALPSTSRSGWNLPSVTRDSSSLTAVQDRLNAMGYNAGPGDGVLGKRTQDALRQFQQTVGLPVTGQPDAATRQALGVEANAQH